MPVGAGKYQLGRAGPVGPARQQRIQAQVRPVGGVDVSPLLEAQQRYEDQVADTKGQDFANQLIISGNTGIYGDGRNPGILSVTGDPTPHYTNLRNEINQQVLGIEDKIKDMSGRGKDFVRARVKAAQLKVSNSMAMHESKQFIEYREGVNNETINLAAGAYSEAVANQVASDASDRVPANDSSLDLIKQAEQNLQLSILSKYDGNPNDPRAIQEFMAKRGEALFNSIDNTIASGNIQMAQRLIEEYKTVIPNDLEKQLNARLKKKQISQEGTVHAENAFRLPLHKREKYFMSIKDPEIRLKSRQVYSSLLTTRENELDEERTRNALSLYRDAEREGMTPEQVLDDRRGNYMTASQLRTIVNGRKSKDAKSTTEAKAKAAQFLLSNAVEDIETEEDHFKALMEHAPGLSSSDQDKFNNDLIAARRRFQKGDKITAPALRTEARTFLRGALTEDEIAAIPVDQRENFMSQFVHEVNKNYEVLSTASRKERDEIFRNVIDKVQGETAENLVPFFPDYPLEALGIVSREPGVPLQEAFVEGLIPKGTVPITEDDEFVEDPGALDDDIFGGAVDQDQAAVETPAAPTPQRIPSSIKSADTQLEAFSKLTPREQATVRDYVPRERMKGRILEYILYRYKKDNPNVRNFNPSIDQGDMEKLLTYWNTK